MRMKQRPRSSRCTLPVVAVSVLTGCVRAPSTVAASDVPTWAAPLGIGVVFLLAAGLRALFLIRRRQRKSAGPGVTAQLAKAEPPTGPTTSVPGPPPPPPPGPAPTFGPPPLPEPSPLSGPPEFERRGPGPAGPLLPPPPPPSPQPAPAPTASGPVAGWYPDPGGRHAARYWDGGSWTRHTR